MNIFKVLTNNVAKVFNTIGSTADSVERGLDIANVYVEQNHKRAVKVITANALMSTAHHHIEHQAELDDNPKLAAIYAKLEESW
jgi:hypothetical protein